MNIKCYIIKQFKWLSLRENHTPVAEVQLVKIDLNSAGIFKWAWIWHTICFFNTVMNELLQNRNLSIYIIEPFHVQIID